MIMRLECGILRTLNFMTYGWSPDREQLQSDIDITTMPCGSCGRAFPFHFNRHSAITSYVDLLAV